VIDRAQLWGDDTHNADGIIILWPLHRF
jgi:hypothetical protein